MKHFMRKTSIYLTRIFLLYLYNPAGKSPLISARFSLLSASQINAAETFQQSLQWREDLLFQLNSVMSWCRKREQQSSQGPVLAGINGDSTCRLLHNGAYGFLVQQYFLKQYMEIKYSVNILMELGTVHTAVYVKPSLSSRNSCSRKQRQSSNTPAHSY